MRSLTIACCLLAGSLMPLRAQPATPLERILEAAAKTPEWPAAATQNAKLKVLRVQALRYAAVSDVPSDRYLITALAGPVDLVRFFQLARTVCEGSKERRPALLHQWNREHAAALKAAPSDSAPSGAELTPDDLPSNALGALFGEELKAHENDAAYDLAGALRKFFAPLEPVPDTEVAKHTFAALVYGLPANPSQEAIQASRTWISATPLFILPTIAPDRVKTLPDAAAALKAAGLEVRLFEGEPIVIDRLDTPDPIAQSDGANPPAEVAMTKSPAPADSKPSIGGSKTQKEPDTPIGHLFMRPPQGNLPPVDKASPGADSKPAPKSFPKAVPVPEYPKAVPVQETPPAKTRFLKAVPVD